MRTLTWMGTISCSLYLVHTIIGGKIVNIGGRLPQSPWNATLIIGTACGASILFSMDILSTHRGSIEALDLIDPVQKERKR